MAGSSYKSLSNTADRLDSAPSLLVIASFGGCIERGYSVLLQAMCEGARVRLGHRYGRQLGLISVRMLTRN